METMPDDRWTRLDDLFERALALAPGERAAFLDREAADDPALRAEAQALLDAHGDAEAYFDGMARALAPPGDALAPGARVGPYRVVAALGRGGMGTVYRAERADGQFERAVALKVFRAGDPRRFLAERRILARLDHPGIARLYGGGVLDDGRPYFAMELVEGLPITAFADAMGLDVEGRLALFADVCDAVQYAHAQLVVHRDLKPSNVLVDPGHAFDAGDRAPHRSSEFYRPPRVKLLDFGVAKLVSDAEAALTATGAAPLTPAYAAPEQVRGDAVSTATDVYALGVLLFELLTGRRPYRLADRARAAVERAILDTDPMRPSEAVTETAPEAAPDGEAPSGPPTGPAAAPARLARRLQGDLDQIVLKALRKAPAERYATAEAFARDVARHLDGRPIEARPQSAASRAWRFVRRHLAGVAVAALGVALLAGWAATATLQRARVAAERDRARALNDVLVGLLEGVDPTLGGDRGLTVAAFLDDAGAQLQRDLADRPDLRADLLAVVAASRLGLGDPAAADSVAALAAEAAATLPPGHPARTKARAWHAWTRTFFDDYDTAERVYRELLAEAAPADRPELQVDFGIVLGEMGRPGEARALLRDAVAALERAAARDPARRADLASALDELASSHEDDLTGDGLAAAWPLMRRAVAIKAEVWGPDHPRTAESVAELAGLAARRGDHAASDSLFGRAAATLEAAYGPEHLTLATVLNNWAYARHNPDPAGADSLYRRALAIREAVYGERHQETAGSYQNLAALLSGRPGRAAEALALFDRAEAIYRDVMPDGHYLAAFPAAGRAWVHRAEGRTGAALRDGRRAFAALADALGPDHGATLQVGGQLGVSLVDAGRVAEAAPLLRAALAADLDLSDDDRRDFRRALAQAE